MSYFMNRKSITYSFKGSPVGTPLRDESGHLGLLVAKRALKSVIAAEHPHLGIVDLNTLYEEPQIRFARSGIGREQSSAHGVTEHANALFGNCRGRTRALSFGGCFQAKSFLTALPKLCQPVSERVVHRGYALFDQGVQPVQTAIRPSLAVLALSPERESGSVARICRCTVAGGETP